MTFFIYFGEALATISTQMFKPSWQFLLLLFYVLTLGSSAPKIDPIQHHHLDDIAIEDAFPEEHDSQIHAHRHQHAPGDTEHEHDHSHPATFVTTVDQMTPKDGTVRLVRPSADALAPIHPDLPPFSRRDPSIFRPPIA